MALLRYRFICWVIFVITATISYGQTSPLPSAENILEKHVQELEKRTSELRSNIAAAEGKLRLLEEQLTGTFDSDAKLLILAKNEIGPRFVLDSSEYVLDGKKLLHVSGEIRKQDKKVFEGFVTEGEHTLEVISVYVGNSSLFSFFSKEKVELKDSVRFIATLGKTAVIEETDYEKGNWLTPVLKRPQISVNTFSIPNLKIAGSIVPLYELTADAVETIDGTSIQLIVDNAMGGEFRLKLAKVFIDGAFVYEHEFTGDVARQNILNEPVAQGEHVVEVVLFYKGNEQRYSYLRGFDFELKFNRRITVPQGKGVVVTLVADKESLSRAQNDNKSTIRVNTSGAVQGQK